MSTPPPKKKSYSHTDFWTAQQRAFTLGYHDGISYAKRVATAGLHIIAFVLLLKIASDLFLISIVTNTTTLHGTTYHATDISWPGIRATIALIFFAFISLYTIKPLNKHTPNEVPDQ